MLTLTGNESIGLGAIAGGLQFYAAYPMTPSSSLLHFLAKKAPKVGIVVKHAEDEIGAVNMALGASFTGVRSMVGTSGGGFTYMTEALGMSGVAELPLVVFESMRPGPALGMPTWTAQGDLLFILNASQDEFPRFVLAPGDAREAFDLTRKALELAEKYQTLVMVVSDKFLSESRHTMKLETSEFENVRHGFEDSPVADESGFYPRYQKSEDGVSDRTRPGTAGGNYVANSYEHDEYGLATEEGTVRKEMVDRRFLKFEQMKKEVPQQFYETVEGAVVTLICFGSTKGPVIDARILLESEGIKTNLLHISWLWPFPKMQVETVINSSQKTLVIEGNHEGQLSKLIAQETGFLIKESLKRYDGRPFYKEDIVDYVRTNYGSK
jgi:2-oxoglutarate ferredoxin oxidoreductase subunit alpha